jgi:hypothetical protein
MDYRWRPVSRDSKRELKVLLHREAAIHDVRRGEDVGENDIVDLTPFVTQGSQSAFECTVTLKFNRELFGDVQPKPNQILEIQFFQDAKWMPLWIGVVEALRSFTLSRGERSLQLIAKTRDSTDIWRNTKRVTPLFPQMTNFTYMVQRIARAVGMMGDEIALPASAFATAHTNTQLADMNAWDMVEAIFLPMGWTPFIDGVGRLRAADRSLQGRIPDVKLDDSRMVKVGGERQRPPASRVTVKWLNPELKRFVKQGQKLTEEIVTVGWFSPYWKRTFYFSEDQTLRAENTYYVENPSVNTFRPTAFVDIYYTQQTENRGKLTFHNKNFYLMAWIIHQWFTAHGAPDGVAGTATVPIGRKIEAIHMLAFTLALMNMGVGVYEIWGNPFDWVHARNTSVAFDSSVPPWVDRNVDVDSDFIVNEEHAKAVAIRELIYQARAANKWSVTLVDDPRIEFGDVLQFPDNTQLYVEDFTRSLERGSEAVVEVSGFLVKPFAAAESGAVIETSPPEGWEPPEQLPPGAIPVPPAPGGGTPTTPGGNAPTVPLPNYTGEVQAYMDSHKAALANSCVPPHGNGTWEFTNGCVNMLRGVDARVGFNGKRGGSNGSNCSADAIAYWHGPMPPVEGGHDVYVVDFIAEHCSPNAHAYWNNVSSFGPGAWYSSSGN